MRSSAPPPPDVLRPGVFFSGARYDLPPVVDAPDGFNTILEGYGKDGALKNSLGSSNRDPILVTW